MSGGFFGHSMHDTRGSAYDRLIRMIGGAIWEALKYGAAQGPISPQGSVANFRSKRNVDNNEFHNNNAPKLLSEAEIDNVIRGAISEYEKQNGEIDFSNPQTYERIAQNIASVIVTGYAVYKTPAVISGLWNLGKCVLNHGPRQTWNAWENSVPNSKNYVSINDKKNKVLLSINVLKNLIGELENLERNRLNTRDNAPNNNANEGEPLVKKEIIITALDYSGKQKDYSLTEGELKSIANILHNASFSAATSRALGDVKTQTA